MGGDNLISLPKWKNYELLMAQYSIYIYKRPQYSDHTDLSIENVYKYKWNIN